VIEEEEAAEAEASVVNKEEDTAEATDPKDPTTKEKDTQFLLETSDSNPQNNQSNNFSLTAELLLMSELPKEKMEGVEDFAMLTSIQQELLKLPKPKLDRCWMEEISELMPLLEDQEEVTEEAEAEPEEAEVDSEEEEAEAEADLEEIPWTEL